MNSPVYYRNITEILPKKLKALPTGDHMARIVRDTKLETREARKGLSKQKEPYWRSVHQGAHIGYYKGDKSASWVARYRHEGDKGGYKKKTIGKTDDYQDADGVNILNYREAQLKAQEWFKQQGLVAEGHLPTGKYTVQDAIDDYGRWYQVHRKSWKHLEPQIKAHILPALGKIEVSKLTAKKIEDWFFALAETPPRRRTSKLADQQNFGVVQTDEEKRKRKSTSNRVLTTLKAALNKAYESGRVAHDDAWRRVKPFKNVDHPRIRYLEKDEIKRLVNVSDNDFKPMVQAALYTGCRYGELCAMQVGDYNYDTTSIYIPDTKSGKPRTVHLNEEGQTFFEKQVLAGKNKKDLMFARHDGNPWERSHQTRRIKDMCERANITPAISFHILRHTHASQLISHGVPMVVVAEQLGNSVKICEKHYAHLSPSYVGDTIRAHFPALGISDASNVEVFKGRKAG